MNPFRKNNRFVAESELDAIESMEQRRSHYDDIGVIADEYMNPNDVYGLERIEERFREQGGLWPKR